MTSNTSEEKDRTKALLSKDKDTVVNASSIVAISTKDILEQIMEDIDDGDASKDSADVSASDEMITETTGNDNIDDDALMSSANANKKLAKKKTATNTKHMTSLQLANANNDNTVMWSYCDFKPRLVSSVSIKDMIWHHIRPFHNVGDVHKISLTIQPIWSHLSPSKHTTPTTIIAHLVEFITLLDKKCGIWT